MSLPKELSYDPQMVVSKDLHRDFAQIPSSGDFTENSRLGSFRIESTQTSLIHPESVALSFKLSFVTGLRLSNSCADLVESVTVYSNAGQTLSHVPMWHSLHSVAADISLNEQHGKAAWDAGLELRDDAATPGMTDRDVSIALNLAGLFSTQTLICPADFGGLRVDVRIRPAAQWLRGSNASYTFKGARLTYEYTDISRDQKMLGVYAKRGRIYHYVNTEVYQTSVGSSGVGVLRVACPSHMKSIKKVTVFNYKNVNGVETRPRCGISSLQARCGTQLIPADKVRGLADLKGRLDAAYGHPLGYLDKGRFEGDRFVAALPMQQFSQISGFDAKDQQLEVYCDASSSDNSYTCVAAVQGDAYWDSGSQMVTM